MKTLWKTDAVLTAVSLLQLAALAAFVVGMIVDPRLVAGAPAWLKPPKFAASLAIYGLTLAWMFRFLPDWPRTRRAVGAITAAVGVIEVGLIALQAWRGTTSHFNVATPFDIAVFATMGAAILVQWIASLVLAAALWRQPFVDAALGAALRAGLLLAIVGAAMGGLMTQPSTTQITVARATGHMAVSGSHTVGGPDGGPGLPGTQWSTEHGDLRVPHFLGLHALQVLPLVAVALAWIRRSPAPAVRLRLVRIANVSYATLTAILLWQALRGQSIAAPDALTLAVLAAWAAGTAAAAATSRFHARRGSPAVAAAVAMGAQ